MHRLFSSEHPQAWVTLCFVFAACCCNRDVAVGNTGKALRQLRLLNRVEASYYSRHGQYADLSTLGRTGEALIPRELAAGQFDGYEYRIDATPAAYQITAWPLIHRETGLFSFYCDETGIIRQAWGNVKATVLSPPINRP
jgi:hypothetical protein